MCRTNLSLLLIVAAALILGGCSQPSPIADSPETRLEQARALTALEVESGALDAMLDEGAALARQATADMLMIELEREPSEEDVAKVYAENFTAAELQETVAFYTSPTGLKIMGLGGTLDGAVGEAVETALEVHSDEFAARVDAALAESFPELAGGGS